MRCYFRPLRTVAAKLRRFKPTSTHLSQLDWLTRVDTTRRAVLFPGILPEFVPVVRSDPVSIAPLLGYQLPKSHLIVNPQNALFMNALESRICVQTDTARNPTISDAVTT